MDNGCAGFSLCSSIGAIPKFVRPHHVVEFMRNNARVLAGGNASAEQIAIIAQDMEYIAKNMSENILSHR